MDLENLDPQNQAPAQQDTSAAGEPTPVEPPEIEVRGFNQEDREVVEDAYDRFLAAERGEPAPDPQPNTTPAQQDTSAAGNTGVPAGVHTPGEDPQGGQPPRFKYRNHEEAERGAEEAARRMHEATSRASELERQNEQLRNAALKILASVQAQGGAPDHVRVSDQGGTPPAPAVDLHAPIPGLDYDRIEQDTGFAPAQVNFLLNALGTLRDGVLTETQNTITTREAERTRSTAREQFNKDAETYFQTKHAAFVPIRETVMRMTHEIWNDKPFIAQVMSTTGKKPVEKFYAILDEAVERVKRDRLPTLLSSLGVSGSPAPQSGVVREPLQSGSPPPVPRGSGAPVVRPAQVDRGESPEEYVANRRKMQDRMLYGRRSL